MSIATDLRAIADSANRDLDHALDFYEHSKAVWRAFETFVGAGHKVSAA